MEGLWRFRALTEIAAISGNSSASRWTTARTPKLLPAPVSAARPEPGRPDLHRHANAVVQMIDGSPAEDDFIVHDRMIINTRQSILGVDKGIIDVQRARFLCRGRLEFVVAA